MLKEFWLNIFQFWWFFIFNAGHHTYHYLPPIFLHHHPAYRHHLRILYRQIIWFFNHSPSYGRFQQP